MEDKANTPEQAAEQPSTESSTDIFGQRRARLHEYLLDGLAKPDAYESIISNEQADLMAFALKIRESMDKDLSGGPKSLEELESLVPAMAAYTRIAKQIGRNNDTLLKIKDAQAQ